MVISPAHIDGLKMAIDQAGALAAAELRILAVPEGSAIDLPDGPWTFPDGKVVDSGGIVHEINLPAEGILVVGASDEEEA